MWFFFHIALPRSRWRRGLTYLTALSTLKYDVCRKMLYLNTKMYSLFVCFEPHGQFFSYLATVTIAGDRAANLDQCLALTAFSSEGSFTCHTHCDTGPSFLRSYPKEPWFSLLNVVLLAKEQSLPILNVLGLTRPARAGLELTFNMHNNVNINNKMLSLVFYRVIKAAIIAEKKFIIR
jgi:hypothetical protein